MSSSARKLARPGSVSAPYRKIGKKKRRKSFRTEQQLFAFIDAKLTQSGVDRELKKLGREPEEDTFAYRELQKSGKTVHVLGETHCSRKPMDLVHENLADHIVQEKESWIFLVEEVAERVERHNDRWVTTPATAYVCELAMMLGIPVEEALADIYSQETRARIASIGVEESLVDQFLFSMSIKASHFFGMFPDAEVIVEIVAAHHKGDTGVLTSRARRFLS